MKTFDINKIKLEIQSPDIQTDEALDNYLIGHIEKLGKIFNRIERCEMMLRLENTKKENCQVDVKIFVPGNVLFASEKQNDFRLASKMAFDDLHDQLYKFKEKRTEKF